MPIYEFRCLSCRKVASFLVRNVDGFSKPGCPACGAELERIVSSFAQHRSVGDVQEASGSPDRPGPGYYNDPRNIGRWTEKRFQEMGMEMPSEIDGMIQAAREGELPESVKDLRPGIKEI